MGTPCPLRYSPLMPLPGRQVAIPVMRHLLAEINNAVNTHLVQNSCAPGTFGIAVTDCGDEI